MYDLALEGMTMVVATREMGLRVKLAIAVFWMKVIMEEGSPEDIFITRATPHPGIPQLGSVKRNNAAKE